MMIEKMSTMSVVETAIESVDKKIDETKKTIESNYKTMFSKVDERMWHISNRVQVLEERTNSNRERLGILTQDLIDLYKKSKTLKKLIIRLSIMNMIVTIVLFGIVFWLLR